MNARAERASPFRLASDLSPLRRSVRVIELARNALGGAGFDGASALERLSQEVLELGRALEAGGPERRAAIEAELGDVLFSAAGVGAALEVDPEHALDAALDRLERRFASIAEHAEKVGKTWSDLDGSELDALWKRAKRSESARASERLFLSAPITTFSREACLRYYDWVAELVGLMNEAWRPVELYCAALALRERGLAQTPAAARDELFARIDASSVLILLWPEAAMSSALIEVGYALARGIPVLCFQNSEAALPFLLTEGDRRVRVTGFGTPAELEALVRSSTLDELLPSP